MMRGEEENTAAGEESGESGSRGFGERQYLGEGVERAWRGPEPKSRRAAAVLSQSGLVDGVPR